MFITKENEKNQLIYLSNSKFNMNWIESKTPWGSVICKDGVKVSIKRKKINDNRLREEYIFQNISDFPISFIKKQVGIYTTFNDNYEDTQICINEKCHTHIFVGEQASYVMCLQMGGKSPNLGLQLVKGCISGYSVERDLKEESNDRGDFILHPKIDMLQPNEKTSIIWDLFWFENREDFYNKLLENENFPVVKSDKFVYFNGETINFDVNLSGKINDINILLNGSPANFSCKELDNLSVINVFADCKTTGEYVFDIYVNNVYTQAKMLVLPDFSNILQKRCKFIANKQQYHNKNSMLDGAYLIYDNEEKQIYYSHLDDHNGSRERICMGILMASYLQKNKDDYLLSSLQKYIKYVYRELYDKNKGIVYNDINRNLDWHRLYNYPWFAVFQLELFNLFKDIEYLKDSAKTMKRYYIEGGKTFYAIAIPANELYNNLIKQNLFDIAQEFKNNFLEHCDVILKNSTNYPPFEVRYEQSIVQPAVYCLLQAYELSNDKKYLEETHKQMNILQLFNAHQANYNQFEVSIRHWDGKWFGKNRLYGDTYPHYWSSLTGIAFKLYSKYDKSYKNRAIASLRASLSLFFEDGSASCAMVYPEMVNNQKACFYDPWANDQDWALYFAYKYLF